MEVVGQVLAKLWSHPRCRGVAGRGFATVRRTAQSDRTSEFATLRGRDPLASPRLSWPSPMPCGPSHSRLLLHGSAPPCTLFLHWRTSAAYQGHAEITDPGCAALGMCDLRLLERTQAPRLRTWATRVQFLALPTAQTQLVLGLGRGRAPAQQAGGGLRRPLGLRQVTLRKETCPIGLLRVSRLSQRDVAPSRDLRRGRWQADYRSEAELMPMSPWWRCGRASKGRR